jgi:hypothetical protein
VFQIVLFASECDFYASWFFEVRRHCKEYFCKTVKENEQNRYDEYSSCIFHSLSVWSVGVLLARYFLLAFTVGKIDKGVCLGD